MKSDSIKFVECLGANTGANASKCENDNICLTPICVYAAAHILDRIDPSVDPCDDFYQFSCGTFLKNAIITDEMSEESMVTIINRKIQYQIRTILAEEPTPNDLNAFKLAKKFYKSCMDEASIEKRGVQPLIDLTKSYGGWPVIEGNQWNESSWNWYDVYKKMFVGGLNLSPLFQLKISPSLVNSTLNRLNVIYIRRWLPMWTFYIIENSCLCGISVWWSISIGNAARAPAERTERFESAEIFQIHARYCRIIGRQ